MEKEMKAISDDELAKITGGSYDFGFALGFSLLVTRYYKEGYTLEQTMEEIKKQMQGTEYNYLELIGITYEIWGTLEEKYPDRNVPL